MMKVASLPLAGLVFNARMSLNAVVFQLMCFYFEALPLFIRPPLSCGGTVYVHVVLVTGGTRYGWLLEPPPHPSVPTSSQVQHVSRLCTVLLDKMVSNRMSDYAKI